MQIRVLSPVINPSIMIAFLSSLIMFLPCQIGEAGMHGPVNGAALTVPRQYLGQPLANAEFIPSHLATATEATQGMPSPSVGSAALATPGPTGPTVVPSLIVSATATAEPPSPTVIATGTRFVETAQVGTSTRIATDVRRVKTTPAPLLTSLARNKPSIWGSEGFYVLLGLIYVTLLGLFIKHIISISGGGREQR